ncbi:hypothetical protein EKO27_g8281 [Xylaria grammica]|uniref:Uncharacterized protein n=1 Tax=Xylaria grammica TaxID=363999 RepID=A0A439CX90_9PEZI|nr:hypothetical protein EKO27_g8281 [Xylaria grammica]
MHVSTLNALFIAIQALCVHALPPKVQFADGLEPALFTPTNPIPGWPATTTGSITNELIPWTPTSSISGWPHSSSLNTSSISYVTTTVSPVITATTITVTDNSITWTPTQSVSGWPPSSSKTRTGLQLTETFTITYTSYSEETISLPPPSSVVPAFTFVTVTVNPTASYTVVTVTATETLPPLSPGAPRFTTITVSEVTLWPTPTTTPVASTTSTPSTTQSSTQSSQLVTLTLSSSSVNESLNSTSVSYSSTVMTLNPPPTFATGTATVGTVGRRHV